MRFINKKIFILILKNEDIHFTFFFALLRRWQIQKSVFFLDVKNLHRVITTLRDIVLGMEGGRTETETHVVSPNVKNSRNLLVQRVSKDAALSMGAVNGVLNPSSRDVKRKLEKAFVVQAYMIDVFVMEVGIAANTQRDVEMRYK